MRTQFVMAVFGGLAIGLGLSQLTVPRAAQSQEAKGTKKAAETKEFDSLKFSAAAFEKAFNAGDAKAIAAQFAENAEVVDEDGNVVQGRANIEAFHIDSTSFILGNELLPDTSVRVVRRPPAPAQ